MYHEPFSTYEEYNKSLALQLQRNGPILGFVPTYWAGFDDMDHWTLELDEHRWIRCYENYDLASVPFSNYYSHDYYTKCIRLGTGWSADNKHASFSVPGIYDTAAALQGPDVSIDVYSSDRAVFLHDNTWPSWLPSTCLANKTANGPACDWDRFFTIDETLPLANRSRNVITIEMKTDNGTNSATLAMDFVTFLGFTTYTFDTSQITNPTYLVQTRDLPLSGTIVTIDPSWILAGWSVDGGGVLSAQRTSANLVQKVMSSILKYQKLDARPSGPNDLEYVLADQSLAFTSIAHALSLIDHQTSEYPQLTSWPNEEHPLLQRNARMYVWGYFMASRTSTLGAVVTIAGIIVVLAQGCLGFVDKRRYQDPVQLLIAALRHVPHGEFDDTANDEKIMARIRFRMEDRDGRVKFLPRQSGIQ